MFCPHCRDEYREGIEKCADCDVVLVCDIPSLPPESELAFVDYQEVLATYNPGDIALIKSILDDGKIIYFFKGENFTYIRPLADPARLMVKTDQVQEAFNILSDLKLSLLGINPRKY